MPSFDESDMIFEWVHISDLDFCRDIVSTFHVSTGRPLILLEQRIAPMSRSTQLKEDTNKRRGYYPDVNSALDHLADYLKAQARNTGLPKSITERTETVTYLV